MPRSLNGQPFRSLALVKLGYMLESLSISRYCASSDNAMSAENQQETEAIWDPQRLHAKLCFYGYETKKI